MNNDIFKGKWKQFQGRIQQKWGKLTDNHMDQINGSWDEFVGSLQENYGINRQEAEKQWNEFEQACQKEDKAA